MSSDRSSQEPPPSSSKLPADIRVPPPAGPQNTIPDAATRKDPIFTDGHAPNQVFHFQKFGISYGTDDKGHAAAILLSVSILVLIFVIVFVGAWIEDRNWLSEILKVLGNAFLIVTGIAVGKSVNSNSNN